VAQEPPPERPPGRSRSPRPARQAVRVGGGRAEHLRPRPQVRPCRGREDRRLTRPAWSGSGGGGRPPCTSWRGCAAGRCWSPTPSCCLDQRRRAGRRRGRARRPKQPSSATALWSTPCAAPT
jgi:hypothetical protein